jgi:hypothetical protein
LFTNKMRLPFLPLLIDCSLVFWMYTPPIVCCMHCCPISVSKTANVNTRADRLFGVCNPARIKLTRLFRRLRTKSICIAYRRTAYNH